LSLAVCSLGRKAQGRTIKTEFGVVNREFLM